MECLRLTTAYLSTKLEGGGDVETLIRNRKVFEPAWPDLVGPNPAATKAMLHAEYGTRAKRVEKLHIYLSTEHSLVLGSARTSCDFVSKYRRDGMRRRTSETCSDRSKKSSPCCKNTTRTQSTTM